MTNYHERAEFAWSEDSTRIIATPTANAKALFYYVQEIGHLTLMEALVAVTTSSMLLEISLFLPWLRIRRCLLL